MANSTSRVAGVVRRPSFVLLLSVSFLACVLLSTRIHAQAKASHPLPQDESCLACHGQAGMTSANGKSISIDPAKHVASAHGILGCNDCHATIKNFPHPKKVAKVECSTCHADEASHAPASVHGAVGVTCQSCHGKAHEVSAAAQLVPTKCAQCHADEAKELRQSIHGQAVSAGDPDAPTCLSCHGEVHQIQASSDAASRVDKKNLPDTCASCHSNQQFLSRHKIPFAHPVELYRQSVHGERWRTVTRPQQVARIVTGATAFFPRKMLSPRSITGIFRQRADRATRKSPIRTRKACMDKR